jgi:hypothetical protein
MPIVIHTLPGRSTGPHGVRRASLCLTLQLSEGVEYGNRPVCKMTIDENIGREHEPFSRVRRTGTHGSSGSHSSWAVVSSVPEGHVHKWTAPTAGRA